MSEWGPWIEHDGNGCPCVGEWAQVIYADGDILFVQPGKQPFSTGSEAFYDGPTFLTSWDWFEPGNEVPVIRYRIRKPRGLTILENLIADLPAPSAPKVEVGA